MVKVIKHGHEQYRMTCRFCECIFSFEDADIKTSGDQRDWCEWIYCPECKRLNDIERRETYRVKYI